MKPLLWIGIGLLAAVALAACAQPRAARSDQPPRVHHLLLEVKNLETSIRFYHDLMGLDVKSRTPDFVTLSKRVKPGIGWCKRRAGTSGA